MAKDNGVSVSPDTLREKSNEILEIDEWLESVSGSASAGKTAIKNALVKDEKFAPVIENMITSIEKYLADNGTDEAVQAAIFYGVTKGLDAKFGKVADTYVTTQAEANKSESTVSATDDEIAEKRAVRKQKVVEFNALKGILEMFGKQDEIADIPDPKVLRGAIPGQKRKPRKINLMTFSVDGEEVPSDQNNLPGVGSIVGLKVKELRKVLTDAGVNLKDPADFSVEVNGKTVSAVKGTEADSETEAASE